MKGIKILLSLLISTSMMLPVSVFAEEEQVGIDVVENQYVMLENGVCKNADIGIQQALEVAREPEYTEENPCIIHIPAGEYYLDNNLYIYSNTQLILDENAHMISTTGLGQMLKGVHVASVEENPNVTSYPWVKDGYYRCYANDESCTHGRYTQSHNILVQGGLWSQTPEWKGNNGIFAFKHADGITIKDCIVENSSNHFFNVSSTRNLVVDGVTFRNQTACTDPTNTEFWGAFNPKEDLRYGNLEAVHLDFAGEGEVNAYPIDGTPCVNVTVNNCTFKNVSSAMGNHHAKTSDLGHDYTFTNNTFDCDQFYKGNMVVLFSVYNVEVANNTAKNCKIFAQTQDGCSNVKIHDNEVLSNNQTGVRLRGSKNIEVYDNTIKGSSSSAIRIESTQSSKILRNTIDNVGYTNEEMSKHAIHANEVKDLTIDHNIITNVGSNAVGSGIRVAGTSSNYAITNNTISKTVSRGIDIGDDSSISTLATVSDNTITNIPDVALNSKKVNNLTVERNKISGSGTVGIRNTYVNTATVSSNTVSNSNQIGINSDNSSNITVTKNTLENIGTVGIRNTYVNTSTVSNNTVNNTSAATIKSSSAGIWVDNSSSNTVLANTVTNNGIGIRVADNSTSTKIQNNTINTVRDRGIDVNGTNGLVSTLTISGNKISNTTTSGMVVTKANTVVISSNTTNTTKSAALKLKEVNSVKVAKNTHTKMGDTTSSSESHHGYQIDSCKTVVIDGNSIATVGVNGNGSGIRLLGASSNITINANAINQCQAKGLEIGDKDHTITTLNITANKIYNSKGNAIQTINTNKMNINNNVIKVAGNDGMRIHPNSATINILSNSISGCTNYGIEVGYTSTYSGSITALTMQKNVIAGSKSIAVQDKVNNSNVTSNVTNAAVVNKTTASSGTVVKNNGQSLAGKTMTLSFTAATYTGSALKPKVTVTGVPATGYTITYANNTNVGTATVTVTGKGVYYGSLKKTFIINPKGTTIKALAAASKGFKVTLNKQATQTTGYQIQYSLYSNFASPKAVTITKNTTLTSSITKLSGKKKYFVRVRTYRTTGGKNYYSGWSAAKYITTKA